MSDEAAIAAFRAELRRAFEDFQADEQCIRSQYARAVQESEAPPGADDDELLERPTRRFLIDRMLRALDWNPDDPRQVVEEARSWNADDERLYFDYLGIAPNTRAPVVLVEAKACDVGAARRPRGQNVDACGMADLISGAISTICASLHFLKLSLHFRKSREFRPETGPATDGTTFDFLGFFASR